MGKSHISDIETNLSAEDFCNFTLPEGSVTYPYDDNMLITSSIESVAEFGNGKYKGGVCENALPWDIKHEILHMNDTTRQSVAGVPLPISSKTGHIDFPQNFRTAFSANFLDYIQSFSEHFNEAGDWDAEFLFQSHLSLRQLAASYHPDSWSGDEIRQIRAFTSVSNTPEGQAHETEILMTDGLTRQQVRGTFNHMGSYKELPDVYDGRIRLMNSGDILMLKGLGDGHTDLLRDALIHRGPPHKNTYPEEGNTRDTLIWQRHIEFEPDMG